MIKRLLSLILLFTLVLACIPGATPALASDVNIRNSAQLPALHEIYKNHFLIGNIFTAIYTYESSNIADQRSDLLKRHFNVLTAENVMKPLYMSYSKGNYNFTVADRMVKTISDAGIAVHGHALVWHSQSAAWLNTPGTTRAEARANLEAYIKAVAGHYKGRVISWDVVNEAFRTNVDSMPSDWKTALRTGAGGNEGSRWFAAYANGADASKGESGADYIYDAFVFARLADPGAILYYNDFNEEFRNKREAMAMMAEDLNKKWASDPRNTQPGRLLVEGLGMQAHYWTDQLDVKDVEDTIKRFITTGVEISITELDIPAGSWRGFKNLTEAEEKKQAQLYAELFRVFKRYSDNIARVTIWGLEDSASWRKEGRPLLFSSDFTPKLAYFAVADPEGYLAGNFDTEAKRQAWIANSTDPLDSASSWARDFIIEALDSGLVPDKLQNNYQLATTRAEFCALAVTLYEKVTGGEITERAVFNDTNDINVQKMGGLDVVEGVGNGNFAPNNPLTREQAATMLSRLADAIGEPLAPFTSTFADRSSVAAWAADAVGQMQGSGIMTGVGENSFNPKGSYERQQSIITMLRLFEHLT